MGLLDELLSGIGETYNTLSGNERIKQRAKGYGDAFQQGLLSALPILAKQPQDITPEDAINSGLLGAIKVFHGSPHKFDAFDMSKIGTGEGAQAYGHGLYFAENPKTAEWYKEKLGGYDADADSRFLNKWYDMLPDGDVKKSVGRNDPIEEILSSVDNEIEWLSKNYPDDSDIGILSKFAQEYRDGDFDKSYLYETSLEWPDPAREAADPLGPQHFLDWDKPLSESMGRVKNALSDEHLYNLGIDATGKDAYTGKELSVSDFAKFMQNQYGDRGSAKLAEAGIPGIRYLDGGSRGAGDGTYNYVVFDDKIPRIVKRSGLLE